MKKWERWTGYWRNKWKHGQKGNFMVQFSEIKVVGYSQRIPRNREIGERYPYGTAIGSQMYSFGTFNTAQGGILHNDLPS